MEQNLNEPAQCHFGKEFYRRQCFGSNPCNFSYIVNTCFIVCGCVPWLYQYWPGGFMVLWFYVQEHQKVQPAVVLVLKRLRRMGKA